MAAGLSSCRSAATTTTTSPGLAAAYSVLRAHVAPFERGLRGAGVAVVREAVSPHGAGGGEELVEGWRGSGVLALARVALEGPGQGRLLLLLLLRLLLLLLLLLLWRRLLLFAGVMMMVVPATTAAHTVRPGRADHAVAGAAVGWPVARVVIVVVGIAVV